MTPDPERVSAGDPDGRSPLTLRRLALLAGLYGAGAASAWTVLTFIIGHLGTAGPSLPGIVSMAVLAALAGPLVHVFLLVRLVPSIRCKALVGAWVVVACLPFVVAAGVVLLAVFMVRAMLRTKAR